MSDHFTIALLVVEDDRSTRENLVRLLRETFPTARIDSTDNLAAAIQMARDMQSRGAYYDVALLDVKLPEDGSGGKAGVHPKLRRELLSSLSFNTVVINHSAHAGDPEILRVVEDLRSPNAPVPVLISADGDWHDEVLRLTRQAVYGRRIAAQLDRLLGPDRVAAARMTGVAARGRMGAEGAGTPGMGALIRDIKQHWSDLDAELQRRVKEVFEIREERDPESGRSDVLVNL
jgi:CheY-like chemotaxis protein